MFVVKNNRWYALTGNMTFEMISEEYFTIKNDAHKILKEYFNISYSEFKDILLNYKKIWVKVPIETLANFYISVSEEIMDLSDLEKTFKDTKKVFKKILGLSLKGKLCDDICEEIHDIYKKVHFDYNPIIVITKVDNGVEKKYAVTEELIVEEIDYVLIERELVKIINSVVLKDINFMANRICNFLQFPLKEVKPYIKITRVSSSGTINAILIEGKNNIPIISRKDSLCTWYAFLRIKEHNTKNMWEYSNSYGYEIYNEPTSLLSQMKSCDETLFENQTCYIERIGTPYGLVAKHEEWVNQCYELSNSDLRWLDSKKEKELREKIEEEGTYAFFKIVF